MDQADTATLPAAGDLPVALSIATSDCGAGAGLQADLLTFAARKVFGTTLFCCLTAQSPAGVRSVAELESSFIRDQLIQLREYFHIGAAKTGMLFNQRIIHLISGMLRERPLPALVVDPVMVATSGAVLLQQDAVQALCNELLPLATLVTPNLDETAVLLRQRPQNEQEMVAAGKALAERFQAAFLIKGGHLESAQEIVDILVTPAGQVHRYSHERVAGVNTHGSGCTLSAAVTAELAKGLPLPDAVEAGLAYLLETMRNPLQVSGERFLAHS